MSKLAVTIEDQVYEVEIDLSALSASNLAVKVDGIPARVIVPGWNAPVEEMEWIVVDDRPHEIVVDKELQWIRSHGKVHPLAVRDLEATRVRPLSGDGRVKAPIPGLITRVLVSPGETVQVGQPLVLLEAMKMENEVRAARTGTVSALLVKAGQPVSLHEVLAEIT